MPVVLYNYYHHEPKFKKLCSTLSGFSGSGGSVGVSIGAELSKTSFKSSISMSSVGVKYCFFISINLLTRVVQSMERSNIEAVGIHIAVVLKLNIEPRAYNSVFVGQVCNSAGNILVLALV